MTYSLSCSLERYYEGRSRLLHKNTSQWPFHSGMNSTIFPRMLILRIWYWIKWSSCWWYLSWILITKFAWYCIDFGRRNYILVIPDYNTSWSPCIFYWQAKYSLKSCSMYLKISRKKPTQWQINIFFWQQIQLNCVQEKDMFWLLVTIHLRTP